MLAIFIILMWKQMVKKKMYIKGILAWSGEGCVKNDLTADVIWA